MGKSAAAASTPPAATARTAKAPKPAAAKGGTKGKEAAKPAALPMALPLDLVALDASQCSELVRLRAPRGFTEAGGAQ